MIPEKDGLSMQESNCVLAFFVYFKLFSTNLRNDFDLIDRYLLYLNAGITI